MKLEEIRTLLGSITPGPWKYDWGNWAVEVNDRGRADHRDEICSFSHGLEKHYIDENGQRKWHADTGIPEDGEFIAHCPTLVPLLLSIAEAAKNLADHHQGIEGGYLFRLKEALSRLEELK